MADNIFATDDRGGVRFQKVLVNSFDGPSCDAFGRWRTSQPQTIFDSKLLHADNQPLFWDESLESGTMATAGPTAAKPFIDFTSTDEIAGKRTRQTFRRFNYQPGKSQLILMTGVLELASGIKTGCQRRIGLFDNDNGAFFESDAGTINIVTRTNDTGSAVDTQVAQTSWNMDTMDGDDDSANPSGITLDITKAQIFVIDFQWLSIGRVRFGLEIAGVIFYVHEVLTANIEIIPWCSTPNLPLRYQIITTTSSGVCSMRLICAVVISEGGTDDIGIIRHQSMQGTHTTAATENTLYALLGFRLKTTHLGVTIKFLTTAIQIHTANELAEWILIFNPTVADTFTYGAITNSALEVAQGVTANTVTGGTPIDGGYVESSQKGGGTAAELDSALELGAAIDGTRDEVVLCIRPIGGASGIDAEGMVVWRELS